MKILKYIAIIFVVVMSIVCAIKTQDIIYLLVAVLWVNNFVDHKFNEDIIETKDEIIKHQIKTIVELQNKNSDLIKEITGNKNNKED